MNHMMNASDLQGCCKQMKNFRKFQDGSAKRLQRVTKSGTDGLRPLSVGQVNRRGIMEHLKNHYTNTTVFFKKNCLNYDSFDFFDC
jgi:hypothetical protein